MKTLLFHIHTKKSRDANIKIQELIDYVIKHKIDYFCVTDHHNFEACEIIEKILQKEEYKNKTQLIKGIEITTEYGDIIPCFIKEPITTRKFDEVVRETKRQKGLLILPHPFDSHTNLDYIVKHVQGIEIWNSASMKFRNRKAAVLANRNPQLLKISAVDAHSIRELGNALNYIDIGKKIEIKPILFKSHGYVISHLRYGKNKFLNSIRDRFKRK